jgi:hypothetical protein
MGESLTGSAIILDASLRHIRSQEKTEVVAYATKLGRMFVCLSWGWRGGLLNDFCGVFFLEVSLVFYSSYYTLSWL